MGKKVSDQQGSTKICKAHSHDHKFNSMMINVLKPKVYITDASNFKKLVQELTGNSIFNPDPPIHHQKPVVIMQDIDIINQDQDSSVDSSEESFPTTAAEECSPETFDHHLLESSNFAINATSNFPDIESWLLEIDNYSYDVVGEYCIPAGGGGFQQDHYLSLSDYDFSDLI